MRISDWSSDVCSSDLQYPSTNRLMYNSKRSPAMIAHLTSPGCLSLIRSISAQSSSWGGGSTFGAPNLNLVISLAPLDRVLHTSRSAEHTSELQSLMRIPYAVFCLKKKIQIE